MMLKLKLRYFGHLMRSVDSLEKTLMLGGTGGRRKRGRQRMRWLDGITDLMDVFEWTLGVGDGQGGLARCDSWVAKSRTRLSDWTELNSLIPHFPSRSCICTYLRLIPSFSDLNFPDIREILKNTKTEKLWSFPLGLTSPITQDRGYYKEKLGEKKRIFVSLYILKKHKN